MLQWPIPLLWYLIFELELSFSWSPKFPDSGAKSGDFALQAKALSVNHRFSIERVANQGGFKAIGQARRDQNRDDQG